MLLYPTETIYALGVNAFDETEKTKLFQLKGRIAEKGVSWLVRNMDDVAQYAEVPELAAKIAAHFLPGPLTLVLRAKDTVPLFCRGTKNEISFRISSDPIAQTVVADFIAQHNAPLTCTSANVSGMPTGKRVSDILTQFGKSATIIDTIYDDGPRTGVASTVVRIVANTFEMLRRGAVSEQEIHSNIGR